MISVKSSLEFPVSFSSIMFFEFAYRLRGKSGVNEQVRDPGLSGEERMTASESVTADATFLI